MFPSFISSLYNSYFWGAQSSCFPYNLVISRMILSFNSLLFINPTSLILSPSLPQGRISSHGLIICFKLFEFMLACTHVHCICHLVYSDMFLMIRELICSLTMFL